MVTEKQACRACGEKFSGRVLLNFGEQEIVDFLDVGETGRGKAPLELVQCEGCGLVQLRHTVDPDVLYKKFWYRSSINPQMRMALEDIVDSACHMVPLKLGDCFCDIGSNDGELLLNYSAEGFKKVGFEPAEALARESLHRLVARQDKDFEIVSDYFNAEAALKASDGKKYKIVTAVAMVYDLDDPKKFLNDVQTILAPDGVFIVQMNYLGLMVRNLAFDNIGHEHLCYYSLTTLKRLFESCGMGIYDVELNDVNGGSIRVYATHKDAAYILEDSTVRELLMAESTQLSEGAMQNFAERVEATSKCLLHFLKELKHAGKRVYAYGASTRGMTLLQCVFKDTYATDYLVAAAERDEKKYGKRMAGLNLPIVSEAEAREKADYFFLCPYHFWSSIREREKLWMFAGGKCILPLPFPKVMAYGHTGSLGSVPVAMDLQADLEALRA